MEISTYLTKEEYDFIAKEIGTESIDIYLKNLVNSDLFNRGFYTKK